MRRLLPSKNLNDGFYPPFDAEHFGAYVLEKGAEPQKRAQKRGAVRHS